MMPLHSALNHFLFVRVREPNGCSIPISRLPSCGVAIVLEGRRNGQALSRGATIRLTQHDDASSLTIQTTIFLAQSSDDTTGVSGSDDAIRDRPSDDTARTDDRF